MGCNDWIGPVTPQRIRTYCPRPAGISGQVRERCRNEAVPGLNVCAEHAEYLLRIDRQRTLAQQEAAQREWNNHRCPSPPLGDRGGA
jgi:hypothetical protein